MIWNKYGKKSIFYRIAWGYLFLLLICVCANMMIYAILRNFIKQQIKEESHITLQLTQRQLEEPFIELKGILNRVYVSPQIERAVYRSSGEDGLNLYDLYRMKKELSEMRSEAADDLFVIFMKSDQVVSARYGTGDIRSYYQCFYSTEKQSYEEWYETTEKRSGRIYAKDMAESPTIAFSCPYPARNPGAVITATVNPEILRELLPEASNGVLLLFDEEGNFLLSSDGKESYELSWLKGEAYFDEEERQKYVCQSSVSELTGFQYIYMVREQLFWNKLGRIFRIMSVYWVIFFLVSAVLIYYLVKKAYRPWKNLADIADPSRESMSKREEEEIHIRNFMLAAIEETRMLNEQIQSRSEKYEEALMLSYLNNSILNKELLAAIDAGCYPVVHSPYILLGIKRSRAVILPEAEERKTEILLKRVLLSRDGMAGDGRREEKDGMLLPYNDSLYIGIIGNAKEAGIPALHQQIKALLGEPVLLAVSEPGEGIEAIPGLFFQVCQCLKYRILFGADAVIEYSQISGRQKGYNRNSQYIINTMYHFLEHADWTSQEVIDKILRETCDTDNAEADDLLELEVDMMKAILTLWAKYLPDQLPPEPVDTGELLFSEFIRLCAGFLEQLKAGYTAAGQKSELIGRVKEFINEQYMNPDLNLNYAANQFQFSAPYLSKLFKSIQHVSVIDYILHVRVEKAKELIVSGKNTIDEVAGKTGFSSSTSFIRAFKKVTGMTPGQYREMYRQ